MSPRNKELSQEMRLQSRAALVAAARKLFAENGYFNVRISDIALQADMSQGNVYWYFSSKEELLKAVLADAFESLDAVIEQAAASPIPASQKLDSLVDHLLEYARTGNEFTAIMLSLMGAGRDNLIARLGFDMDKIGLGYTRSMLSILTQAQAEGVIRPEIDLLAVTMMFFGLFNGLNLTYRQEWLALPEETIKAGISRLLGVLD